MNTTVREQAETKVAAMAAKLSNEALCLAWMATEGQPATQELAITRGWMTDELHKRLGDDLFDEWLVAFDENGNGLNPLTFFERKTVAAKGYTPCWTCAQPATHVMTREGSIALHACDNCTRIDRAEAERLGWAITATKKETTPMNEQPTTALPLPTPGQRIAFTGGGRHWHGTVTRTLTGPDDQPRVRVDVDPNSYSVNTAVYRLGSHFRLTAKGETCPDCGELDRGQAECGRFF